MKVHLLGTAGYHPNESRHTACVAVPEAGLVLDAGSGMFRLAKHLAGDQLDIFLSHVHVDHCVGLTYLLDIVHQHPLQRVTVHGEAVKLEAFRTHLLSEHLFPAPLPCDYRPLTGPVTLVDGGVLQAFPLIHPGGALGFRIDWPDRSLAYVTDTTAQLNAPYLEAIDGVDVLLHECNFPTSMSSWAAKTGHSYTRAVAELARQADVGRLVLIHVVTATDDTDPVGLDEARSIFLATDLGYDQMVIEF
jgi:ribonuclease BN (tRNA processing enzyme)